MEKWVVFVSHWKSRKLHIAYTFNNVLLIWTTTKEDLRGFWVNPCLPRWFLACVMLGCFVTFLDDLYYEPLPWFMIMVKWVVFASHWKSRKLSFMLLTMFLLNWSITKKVWEAFWVNSCLPRWFSACVILGCFVNFLDDHYNHYHSSWYEICWHSRS